MQTWIDRLAGYASKLAALILAAMAAAVVYEVVMRNLFNAPTVWSVEFTSYAMAWLGLIGASEVLRRNAHVSIRVVMDRLPGGGRLALGCFGDAVVAAIATWLACSSAIWTFNAYQIGEVSDTVLQTPQVYVRIAFPLGMALIALVAIARIASSLQSRSRLDA
jgi:TRAP-type C4-dicarboxylate transport system permease small subunit